MSLIQKLRVVSACCLLQLLPACAYLDSLYPKENTPSTNYDPYPRSSIDEVLAFGANMAGLSEASRSDQCQSLIKAQERSPSNDKHLQLMVGRLLSDDCGDIPAILEGVDAISRAYASDKSVQRLIFINTMALQRMQQQSHKTYRSEPKTRKVRTVPEVKDVGEPQKDETRLLREKLEAIRSLEKQMDEKTENP
jgi:hypothetical protein